MDIELLHRMNDQADLLDKLHNRARQGAGLDAMCKAFPYLSRVDLAEWMSANEYPARAIRERVHGK